jgi:hypothetical protein
MNADQQRLEQIRAKIRRINGHGELSPKQWQSLIALSREIALIEGCTSVDDIFK